MGPLVPVLYGRGRGGEGVWARYSPENFEIQKALKCDFQRSAKLGNKIEDKRACFSFKKM